MTTPSPFQTVYLYDPATLLYTEPYSAQLSPADDHSTTPVYLTPMYCCAQVPPAPGKNQCVTFVPAATPSSPSDGKWSLIPDFRGQTIYDQTTGSPQQVISPGAIPSGFALTPPPPTIAQQLAALEMAVQQYIDGKALVRGYDTAASCISYIGSTNTAWKSDATAMNTWRDAVWGFCFTNSAAVKAGTTAMPTAQQLIASLPASPW